MLDDRILLVLPLPIHNIEDQIFIDSQACNSLRLWLENFGHVTLMGPEVHLTEPRSDLSNADSIIHCERLTIVPLPAAWTPLRFISALPSVSKILKRHIVSANYLHFAIGGLWGDWPTVSCLIAQRLGLPYAVWTDRVESQATQFANTSRSGLKRAYWTINVGLMKAIEKIVIRQSALGLFHGMDSFGAYSKFSRNPHLVHDIATNERMLVTVAELNDRLSRTGPLRIAYAGRLHPSKGVSDWIDALALLDCDFCATWFGDGPELRFALDKVRELGLASKVTFVGSIDHAELVRVLRQFDVFLFCHKTLESPRCLIEALQCGVPLVGYETAYSRSLIENGGGKLTAQNDVTALARSISELANDRSQLATLARNAALDGSQFFDEKVFKHRSELMRMIPVR